MTPEYNREYANFDIWTGKHAKNHADVSLERIGAPRWPLDALGAFFEKAYRTFVSEKQQDIVDASYAADWITDNHPLLQRTIRQIEFDLTPGYYAELPHIRHGEDKGLPRIYVLARAMVKHKQGRLTEPGLIYMADRYQDMQSLRMGELWALPIMLRIAVLEALAGALAKHMSVPSPLPYAPAHAPAKDDLDGFIMHAIQSLSTLSVIVWADFFEEVSAVDKILRKDPTGVYVRLDFETRDRYRNVIEHVSRYSSRTETSIARRVLRLAKAAGGPADSRARHVGYYLTAEGLEQLKAQVQYRPTAGIRLREALLKRAAWFYFGLIALLAVAVIGAVIGYTTSAGSAWQAVAAAIFFIVPALTFATDLANRIAGALTTPERLPKLDYRKGVPADAAALVVVPCLITSDQEIDSLVDQLEQHYIRNRDDHIRFALLTDFRDASTKHTDADDPLVERITAGVNWLNKQYPDQSFYLFHRERLWNEQENTWMGWERKRGKLEEFNRLLRGADDTTYTVQLGDLAFLPAVRYVITLDADTLLPRGEAARLIGTLDHPLNQPRINAAEGRIEAGYTLLQPRVEIKPLSAKRSRFTRLFAGRSGLDLYSHAVSDVYQDLFGEGIFVGKGIYHVDAFMTAMRGRVPENAILSHDLFEGAYSRAGLVTDIQLYEDFPADYRGYTKRQHRWIRGDWQLLPWLFPHVPHGDGKRQPNPLSGISIWKMLDNMRRSLIAPALLALLIAGWFWLPGSALAWSAAACLSLLAVEPLAFAARLIRRPTAALKRDSLANVGTEIARRLFFLLMLPYEAYLALHAIGTVLARLLITRRNLLEWVTMQHVTSRASGRRQLSVWPAMYGISFFALLLGGAVFAFRPSALAAALPFLIAWLLAPLVSFLSDRRPETVQTVLPDRDITMLRRLARRTWFYFEQFVGPGDHWLPPDHFQEEPLGRVAHRTSPTNIGLGLLANLSAYDFGYIGITDLGLRLRNSVDTLRRLPMHRGHFLNWYDTRTLDPLPPRYVSTVDSGNLAANFMVIEEACREMETRPFPRRASVRGLLDTLALLEETAVSQADRGANVTEAGETIDDMRALVRAMPDSFRDWPHYLDTLTEAAWPQVQHALVRLVEQSDLPADELNRLRIWNERVGQRLFDIKHEIDLYLPWLTLLPAVPLPAALSETAQTAWRAFANHVPATVSIAAVSKHCAEAKQRFDAFYQAIAGDGDIPDDLRQWRNTFLKALERASDSAAFVLDMFRDVANASADFVSGMDFGFLYDPVRRLFHIGYNVDTESRDQSYYDLLASEARSASLIAVAKRDVPSEHWQYLGRPVTETGGKLSLLSWSGTMFEYLMPALWTRHYKDTLLERSIRTAVQAQIEHGRRNGIPWGMSESSFYRFDPSRTYHYQAFGLPALALKQGMDNDLVIAPYASVLGLAIAPAEVAANLRQFEALGMWSDFGLYESADYTDARLTFGQSFARIKTFMAHHQGMILLAVDNFLHEQAMVNRFHAHPLIRSSELLLQERLPQKTSIDANDHVPGDSFPAAADASGLPGPREVPAESAVPHAHYLSNGTYSVLLTNAGGGFSQYEDRALTRWRSDTTRDDWGLWLYVVDREDGTVWSVGAQPAGAGGATRTVSFSPHTAVYFCRHKDIAITLDVVVHPDDPLEIRRVHVTNQSDRARSIRLVSCAEVVLGPQAADRRHPAFNKLFVEGRHVPRYNALLYTRRARAADERHPAMAHAVLTEATLQAEFGYTLDRARFLGRHGDPHGTPPGLSQLDAAPKPETGLDPLMSISADLELKPHSASQLAFLTVAGNGSDAVYRMLEKYRTWDRLENGIVLSERHGREAARRLKLDTAEWHQYSDLLSLLRFPSATLRAPAHVLASNRKGQPGLWTYGISGDFPILAVRLYAEEDLQFARRLIRAFLYWRRRGMTFDLVFLNEQAGSYDQTLQGRLLRLIQRLGADQWLGSRGGVFALLSENISEADRVLLMTAARVLLDARDGPVGNQLERLGQRVTELPFFYAPADRRPRPPIAPVEKPSGLAFDNDWGGFSEDTGEYVIYHTDDNKTPAPWINVIANEAFGFLVSESGAGFTWAVNSGENRLTPWQNDPVRDRPGEVLYLRDEQTAAVWTPTPLPAGAAPVVIRHGAGVSTFENISHGLHQTLELYAAADAPVKFIRLRLKNLWPFERRITATYYAEWVLGVNREDTESYLQPEYDGSRHALLARNPYSIEFADRVAFLAADREPHGITADRAEFLGRLGTERNPAALRRIGLSGRVRAGADPCAALQVHLDLPAGGGEELVFILGQGANRDDALALVDRFRQKEAAAAALRAVRAFWNDYLNTIQVDTPDPAMNIMLNRWLPYQNLSCRIWGRSAFYQSGGAFGFRDQLQDVTALLQHDPSIARAHILEAAAHQFEEGDVLHWWHPPGGRGVRTRISDDLLWLPYVTAHYVKVTGDRSILDEPVAFLTGSPLREGEHEKYDAFPRSAAKASLYEHCCRALQKGITAGSHGLPLIGGGDWNDGFNRVGLEGKGESVWLGWFIAATLRDFLPLVSERADISRQTTFERSLASLRQALAEHAWDGEWYLRGFYDDGKPLGSHRSEVCRIDAIAQAWAVLSDAGDERRNARAMDALKQHLLDEEAQLLKLFTPAFDQSAAADPGYIKGYPPGIRENGGQYTHAAVWAAWAFAARGDGDTAGALFRLLNPLSRIRGRDAWRHYGKEPYAVTADIYGEPPYKGRGGWSWYTGSGGWLYRFGLEAMLGVLRSGDSLRIAPCIPSDWPEYKITYRYKSAVYEIRVINRGGADGGAAEIRLDGETVAGSAIPLVNDGARHAVEVWLGKGNPA